jgi:hypothetical protein
MPAARGRAGGTASPPRAARYTGRAPRQNSGPPSPRTYCCAAAPSSVCAGLQRRENPIVRCSRAGWRWLSKISAIGLCTQNVRDADGLQR